MSNKQIRAAEAAANEFSNPGISDDSVMTEEGHDVESDLPGAEVSQAHTTRDDEDEEYFDIEEIRSCKLSLRVCHFLFVFLLILTNYDFFFVFLGDGSSSC